MTMMPSTGGLGNLNNPHAIKVIFGLNLIISMWYLCAMVEQPVLSRIAAFVVAMFLAIAAGVFMPEGEAKR